MTERAAGNAEQDRGRFDFAPETERGLMSHRQVLDMIDAAAAALDAAWRRAPAGSRRKNRIRALIQANDAERIAVINKLLANTAARYRPLTLRIRQAGADLRWALQRLDEFQVTASQAAAVEVWATELLPLLSGSGEERSFSLGRQENAQLRP